MKVLSRNFGAEKKNVQEKKNVHDSVPLMKRDYFALKIFSVRTTFFQKWDNNGNWNVKVFKSYNFAKNQNFKELCQLLAIPVCNFDFAMTTSIS